MPPLVVTEMAEFGSLKSFFNKIVVDHQLLDTTYEMLLGFCVDIASGMAYLSSIGVIHRGMLFDRGEGGVQTWNKLDILRQLLTKIRKFNNV
jgi:hypothetical protein